MSQPAAEKHTPGPWTADGRTVLTKWGLIVACCSSDPDLSRTSATLNARLIAAAPQLKDAAEYLLETLGAAHMKCDEQSDTACYGEQYGDANAGEHAYYRELSALLARIEGQS